MDDCGDACEGRFDGGSARYRTILRGVIAINLTAFAVVLGGALLQGSAALAANALDFLADSATYGVSLWAIGRSVAVRSAAAFWKGVSLAALAASVLGYAGWRAFSAVPPEGDVISVVATFGLVANLVAAGLLFRYRDGDANVRSVWLCTRNDLAHGLVVIAAGGLVGWTGARWPDLVAGGLLSAILLHSAWKIIAQSRREALHGLGEARA